MLLSVWLSVFVCFWTWKLCEMYCKYCKYSGDTRLTSIGVLSAEMAVKPTMSLK